MWPITRTISVVIQQVNTLASTDFSQAKKQLRTHSTIYLHYVVFGTVYYCYFCKLKSRLCFHFYLLPPICLVPMAREVAFNNFVCFMLYYLF